MIMSRCARATYLSFLASTFFLLGKTNIKVGSLPSRISFCLESCVSDLPREPFLKSQAHHQIAFSFWTFDSSFRHGTRIANARDKAGESLSSWTIAELSSIAWSSNIRRSSFEVFQTVALGRYVRTECGCVVVSSRRSMSSLSRNSRNSNSD